MKKWTDGDRGIVIVFGIFGILALINGHIVTGVIFIVIVSAMVGMGTDDNNDRS